MILRSPRHDLLVLFFALAAVRVLALADFDCHVTVNDVKFDLTTLEGEHIVNRTRSTPPSTMIDSLRFNICSELKKVDQIPDYDQCPSGTRVCLTKVNQKEHEVDRVTAVIPIAESSNLEPSYSVSFAPKSLSLQLHGPAYSNNTQTLNLTLFCNPETTTDPELVAYDGSRLDLEWHAPAGCPFQEDGDHKDEGNKDDKGDKGDKEEDVGSGIGWFFLVIILAFAAYFGLGAYYNYSTYGASGYDLIPHRDFWKEVPYMFSDVISHLCSTVRPRRTSNRGGYISV